MSVRRACVAMALGTVALAAHGADGTDGAPLWEAGLGVGLFTFPAYRGSDKVENYVLPVPYFTYHGDFFKADRNGVRGDFFDSDRVEVSLSAAASPPTRSGDVAVRDGMPDLRATAELGPEIDVTLWRSASRARSLKFRLPVREAFTLQSPPHGAGVVASPNLALDITDLEGWPGWNFGFLTGPIWSSRAQNAYFYSVAPEFATAGRPAYAAPGGYAGSRVLAAVSKRFQSLWVGAFVRYDTLAGAVFADSPLVTSRHFASAGVAVSWIFAHSSERVADDQ